MPISGKKVVKLLQKKGWKIKSQRGSHIKLTDGLKSISVPVHANKSLGIGLLKTLEKQTGVKLL
ncbi:MAG: type II toxin-antitoxin system HicA family toxin [Bdellovibrionota bacterium]